MFYVRVFAVAIPSVVCLWRSCTQLSWLNFSAIFHGILYPSHTLTSVQTFTEIVLMEPFRRGLNSRWVAKYSDVGQVEGYISETVQYMASSTIND